MRSNNNNTCVYRLGANCKEYLKMTLKHIFENNLIADKVFSFIAQEDDHLSNIKNCALVCRYYGRVRVKKDVCMYFSGPGDSW